MEKSGIHIVLSSSEEFIEHCATTMASILYNLSSDYFAHFYILSYDLTDKSKKKLAKLNKIKKCIIEYPIFDEKLLDMFDGIKIPPHVTKMTYARILIPNILPSIDKVIFIDSDTIVRTDISQLYDIELGDNYLGMVEDACGKVNSRKLWNDNSTLYFNCGVMLINSKKLRDNEYLNLIDQQIQHNGDNYIICDQDVLNDTFKGHIFTLNMGWNFHHEKFFKLKYYNPIDTKEYLEVLSNPYIAHCTGPEKPWLLAINNRYTKDYFFYNKLTLFYRRINNIRYKVNDCLYHEISIYNKTLYLSKRRRQERYVYWFGYQINFLSIVKKMSSLIFDCTSKNNIYKVKCMGISLIEKEDSKKKHCIKFLGINIYKRKIESPKWQLNDSNTSIEYRQYLEREIHQLKEFIYKTNYLSTKVYKHHSVVLPPYKNIYAGKSVVICGSGPTLNYYKQLKNIIHIGLNRVYENNNLKLDYIFAWDFNNLKKDDANFYEKIKKYDAKKIVGLFLDDNISQVSENEIKELDALSLYSSARHGLFQNAVDNLIYKDIEMYPLMDFNSVAFGAFHFTLYTHPLKIYLVGIDNSLTGYFKKEHSQRFLMVEQIKEGWFKVRKFLSIHYPDIEVISINPVGLRGIFKDVYTMDYLRMHPEIDMSKVEILKP